MMAYRKNETIDFSGFPAHISTFEGSERAFDRVGGPSSSLEQTFPGLVSAEFFRCLELKMIEKRPTGVHFNIKLVAKVGQNAIKDRKNG